MIDLTVRRATHSDVAQLLTFWASSAQGHSVSDDTDGVTTLLDRDPDAVPLATTPDGPS